MDGRKKKGSVTFAGIINNQQPAVEAGKETPPVLKIIGGSDAEEGQLTLDVDELARQGALQMLATALEWEVQEYIQSHAGQLDEAGRRQVVRNGRARARKITLGCGTVQVAAPRVNDKRLDEQGLRQRFSSRILPPYMRRSPKVAEVLPVLYLRGLSTGDFKEALPILLGQEASGLSASAICRLTNAWSTEYEAFRKLDLSTKQYVYVWADGVHFNIRLEDDRLCTLVILGVLPDGTKELIAVEDGYRESTESWAFVLRELKRRGMRAPLVAVGDGALGFWAAVRDVWPQTREQRCWVHRLGNVLDKLPRRLQAKAKRALHEIIGAPTREDAQEGMARFAADYGAKYSKAVASLQRDSDKLLTFYDFPADHWVHLRTANPIESAFATVRLRQRVTKGAGSRTKALTMAFKLLEMAQQRWRRINAPHLTALVLEGATFVDGVHLIASEDAA